MGVVGTLKLETPSGTVDVSVWEIADVTHSYLRVATPGGVGAIPLESSGGDTGLRVQTPDGVYGISTTADSQVKHRALSARGGVIDSVDPFLRIASFDPDNVTESWFTWGSGDIMLTLDTDTESYSAVDGTRVVDISDKRGASYKDHSDIDENLPHYPVKGDRWEYYARFTGSTDGDIVCYWGFPETSPPHEDSFEYRLNGSSDETELESNNNENGDVEFVRSSVSFEQDVWYKVDVNYFTGETDTSVEVNLIDTRDGTVLATDTANPASGYDWDNPSLAFLGTPAVSAVVDHIRILSR